MSGGGRPSTTATAAVVVSALVRALDRCSSRSRRRHRHRHRHIVMRSGRGQYMRVSNATEGGEQVIEDMIVALSLCLAHHACLLKQVALDGRAHYAAGHRELNLDEL